MAMTGAQQGGTTSGAAGGLVSGAALGTAIAPGYGTAIGAVVGLVVGGVAGYFSSDDGSGAKMQSIYSQYNAIQTARAGAANARARAAVAGLNADMTLMGTTFNITQQLQFDKYNAQLKSFLGDYNADLLENEAARVWEAADLELLQRGQVFSREFGQMKTGYGASGVMMNSDSPLLAQIDATTQHEMDVMVVKYNADIQAKKILDAAAQSRWEGNMAAQSIIYEGGMNAATTYGNAILSATGTRLQGGIDSAMTLYNSQVNANQILMGGNNAISDWQSKDNQAMASGLFQAGTTVANAYANYKTPTVNKTTGTTGTGVPYRNAPAYGTDTSGAAAYKPPLL